MNSRSPVTAWRPSRRRPGPWSRLVVGLAETGSANARAALVTQSAIEHFDAEAVSFVSVAGALEDDVRLDVHFAPIAADDALIGSRASPTARRIRRHCNDAVAVDMESHGVAQAARMHGTVGMLAPSDTGRSVRACGAQANQHWRGAVTARSCRSRHRAIA